MAVLHGVIPVFLLLGLGTLARRLGWAGDQFVRDLNRVIYWFSIPALLLRLLGKAHLGTAFSGPMILACMVASLAATLSALILSALRREPPARRGVLVQAAVRGNLVYMGFPVIFAAAGTGALTVAAVTVAVLIPFQNLISIWALAVGGEQRGWSVFRAIVLNPVVLGVAGGILWAVIGWEAWPWLDSFLRLLGNIAMPGALLAMGAQLELDALEANRAAAVWATLLKVGLTPAAGLGTMALLGVTGTPRLVGLLLLAAPTAIASTAIAQEMGGDIDLSTACVMASNLAALPSYILWGLLL